MTELNLPTRRTASRVVGVGGIFMRAKNPNNLSKWYSKHLGIRIANNVALFTWLSPKGRKLKGHMVWSLFPNDTSYFGRKDNQFMVNYRVKNLADLLVKLRREGVKVGGRLRAPSTANLAGSLILRETE